MAVGPVLELTKKYLGIEKGSFFIVYSHLKGEITRVEMF